MHWAQSGISKASQRQRVPKKVYPVLHTKQSVELQSPQFDPLAGSQGVHVNVGGPENCPYPHAPLPTRGALFDNILLLLLYFLSFIILLKLKLLKSK
jgi:hypothetical protein